MTQTNRRAFLKATGIIGGGLVLGVSVPALMGKTGQAAGTLHTPNAWVHIADDNTITLLTSHSEMGQGVYTSMPMLIAEELNVDLKQVKVAFAPPGAVYVNSALGAQITGGSTSVRESWEKLRIAGAQVREMLVSAAAERWKVPAASLTAANGVVTGAGGKKATYGELAEAASMLPVPEKPKLKDPKDFRIVGKATKRLDTPAKVFAKAEFGIDVKLPGMLYASVEQCPVIGGTVKSFDGAKAKAMPGVVDVVAIPEGIAVVADTFWHAKKARAALSIVWDEGSVAALSSDSILAGIRVAATTEEALDVVKPVGDVDAAMKGAAKVIKAEYTLPLQAHAPMEPMNFTADWNNGKPIVIGPTQFQQGAQGSVAAALGVKPEDVSVKTTFLGGGFGRRLELDFIVQAALISKAVNKPVKVLWTREDDFTHDFYRPQALNQLEAGVDAHGNPVALKFRVTSQSVTQRAFGLPKGKLDPFMVEAAVAAYEIPNTHHTVVAHDTGLRVGYWRAVSHNMNAFANESFIDELAANAGKDPYQFRLALLKDKPRFATVLKAAAEKAGWGKKLPEGHAHGISIMEGYDTIMAQVAEISLIEGAVRVHRVVVAADLGHMVNPDTVRAQLMSAVIFGTTAALKSHITLVDGKVQQQNFDTFEVVRMMEAPKVEAVLIQSNEKPGGIGEPATALVGPAIANAVFALTGKRVRTLPISAEVLANA